MPTETPEIIAGDNVSRVWSRAFLKTMELGESRIPPLLISVSGFDDGEIPEDSAIKEAIDEEMTNQGIGFDTDAVAFTIFPHSFWNYKKPPSRDALYSNYRRAFPRLLKRSAPNHRRGTYFQRLIDFEIQTPNGKTLVNQLEKILEIWNSSKRHSGLQACCFDPAKDHISGPYLPFPCLQQVSFDFNHKGGLSVNGFYAAQYMFKRAYGNYLGLCQLGRFMAHEMGLRLVRMNCFVAHASVGEDKKEPLRPLEKFLKAQLSAAASI